MRDIISLEERRKHRKRTGKETRHNERVIKKEIRYVKTFDYFLLVLVAGLICFGLIMVYSASYYTAELRKAAGTAEYYFAKQLLCAGIGLVAMIGLMFFDYHKFSQLGKIRPYWILLILGILSLVLVFTPMGIDMNGSRRWVNLGGFQMQPSEVIKAALIIFLACSIGREPRRLKLPVRGFLPYIGLLAAICVIFVLQPNLSAVITVGALVVIMLFVGGARLPHIAIVCTLAVVAVIGLSLMEGYRSDRMLAMSDPMGNYQVRQSLISIGSGGFFGRGLGKSMQKLMYLPFSENDCIFAIIAEELGFIGAGFLLALFGLLIWRGIVNAVHAPDLQGLLLGTGVVAVIAIQMIVNIGVVVNLIPPTGVVLPFISYGGSSLIVFMALMGILLNVSKQASRPLPVRETGHLPIGDNGTAARSVKKEWGI